MAEKIVLDVEIETNGSQQTLGQLEERAEQLNEELRKVPLGSKAFKDLQTELVGVNKEIKNTELSLEALDNEQVASELGSVAGAVGDVTAAFVLLGGSDGALEETAQNIEKALGISMAFKGAIEGVSSARKLFNNILKQSNVFQKINNAATLTAAGIMKLFGTNVNSTSKSFKFLKGAIIGTGIGALVVGLGALIANFDKVSKAVKNFIDRSKVLTSVVDVARDAFNSFVDAIRPALEFLGLLPDEAERAEIALRETAEATATATEKELARAKARGASARELFELEEKILQERIKSLEDEDEKKQLLFDLEILRITEETRLRNEQAEAEKKLEDERKKRREEREKELEEQKKKDKKIAEDKEKERLKAQQEALKAAKARGGFEKEVNLELVEEQKTLNQRLVELYGEDVLNFKAAEERKKQEQLASQNAQFNLASSGINALLQLNEAFAGETEAQQRKAFELRKKLEIAGALVSSAQGVVNILANKSAVPTPFDTPFKAAQIGVLLATTVAQIAAIKKQKFTGSGSVGGSVPGLDAGATPTLSPVTNTSTLVPQEPTKVFVTETDISNTQNKVSVIEDQATIQ